MALIQCPECERQISDRAKSCPHCGFPLDEYLEEERRKEEEARIEAEREQAEKKRIERAENSASNHSETEKFTILGTTIELNNNQKYCSVVGGFFDYYRWALAKEVLLRSNENDIISLNLIDFKKKIFEVFNGFHDSSCMEISRCCKKIMEQGASTGIDDEILGIDTTNYIDEIFEYSYDIKSTFDKGLSKLNDDMMYDYAKASHTMQPIDSIYANSLGGLAIGAVKKSIINGIAREISNELKPRRQSKVENEYQNRIEELRYNANLAIFAKIAEQLVEFCDDSFDVVIDFLIDQGYLYDVYDENEGLKEEYYYPRKTLDYSSIFGDFTSTVVPTTLKREKYIDSIMSCPGSIEIHACALVNIMFSKEDVKEIVRMIEHLNIRRIVEVNLGVANLKNVAENIQNIYWEQPDAYEKYISDQFKDVNENSEYRIINEKSSYKEKLEYIAQISHPIYAENIDGWNHELLWTHAELNNCFAQHILRTRFGSVGSIVGDEGDEKMSWFATYCARLLPKGEIVESDFYKHYLIEKIYFYEKDERIKDQLLKEEKKIASNGLMVSRAFINAMENEYGKPLEEMANKCDPFSLKLYGLDLLKDSSTQNKGLDYLKLYLAYEPDDYEIFQEIPENERESIPVFNEELNREMGFNITDKKENESKVNKNRSKKITKTFEVLGTKIEFNSLDEEKRKLFCKFYKTIGKNNIAILKLYDNSISTEIQPFFKQGLDLLLSSMKEILDLSVKVLNKEFKTDENAKSIMQKSVISQRALGKLYSLVCSLGDVLNNDSDGKVIPDEVISQFYPNFLTGLKIDEKMTCDGDVSVFASEIMSKILEINEEFGLGLMNATRGILILYKYHVLKYSSLDSKTEKKYKDNIGSSDYKKQKEGYLGLLKDEPCDYRCYEQLMGVLKEDDYTVLLEIMEYIGVTELLESHGVIAKSIDNSRYITSRDKNIEETEQKYKKSCEFPEGFDFDDWDNQNSVKNEITRRIRTVFYALTLDEENFPKSFVGWGKRSELQQNNDNEIKIFFNGEFLSFSDTAIEEKERRLSYSLINELSVERIRDELNLKAHCKRRQQEKYDIYYNLSPNERILSSTGYSETEIYSIAAAVNLAISPFVNSEYKFCQNSDEKYQKALKRIEAYDFVKKNLNTKKEDEKNRFNHKRIEEYKDSLKAKANNYIDKNPAIKSNVFWDELEKCYSYIYKNDTYKKLFNQSPRYDYEIIDDNERNQFESEVEGTCIFFSMDSLTISNRWVYFDGKRYNTEDVAEISIYSCYRAFIIAVYLKGGSSYYTKSYEQLSIYNSFTEVELFNYCLRVLNGKSREYILSNMICSKCLNISIKKGLLKLKCEKCGNSDAEGFPQTIYHRKDNSTYYTFYDKVAEYYKKIHKNTKTVEQTVGNTSVNEKINQNNITKVVEAKAQADIISNNGRNEQETNTTKTLPKTNENLKIERAKCLYCEKEIDKTAKFCNFCGKRQTIERIPCSKCGKQIDSKNKFCPYCGEKTNKGEL